MAGVDGSYNCVVKSPLGDQKTVLTVKSDGARFSGTNAGAMGSMDVAGDVAGTTLSWKMHLTLPMTMTLDCEATIDGDTLTGKVGAGAFGSFPMSGTRTA
ncbi:hypothetical protein [Sphingomonas bacterium]|uniref:hypothetical protein n=1 Tax=Sphingomonas bacterium TaxID=1895847 RepID=UPI0015772E9D|nr:hypothetical protein [Sphingomonas bacterium]